MNRCDHTFGREVVSTSIQTNRPNPPQPPRRSHHDEPAVKALHADYSEVLGARTSIRSVAVGRTVASISVPQPAAIA